MTEDAITQVETSLDAGHRRWRHSIGFYVSPFYWGWSGYYGWPYGRGDWSGPYYSETWGAVDLNIKPKNAEVFVDGDYVGRVDQFDGFPRYLWLERGSRNLVVYKEGYESLARRIRVRPGEVLDLRELMVAGVAKTPEELFAQLDTTSGPRTREVAETRVPKRRAPRDVEADREAWRSPEPRSSRVVEDQRVSPGRLFVSVSPADAVVYLDGRLLGSGEELARLHHGLMVDRGEHVVEVTRPGFAGRSRTIVVTASEEVALDIVLERE